MKKKSESQKAVKKIELLAKNEKVTVAELLARAGVHLSTFWRWKTGKTIPDKKTILFIESVCKK